MPDDYLYMDLNECKHPKPVMWRLGKSFDFLPMLNDDTNFPELVRQFCFIQMFRFSSCAVKVVGALQNFSYRNISPHCVALFLYCP